MKNITIRELTAADKNLFITAMQRSQSLHTPWIKAPLTSAEFDEYIARYQQPNQKSFLVFNTSHELVGVFNINDIILGSFQNAFLGFYAVAGYSGQGYMSAGLKLVMKQAFEILKLHRLEANIQHNNVNSIALVEKNGFRYEGFSPRYLKINQTWCGHERWAITMEDYIQEDPEIIQQDCIDLVSYDTKWPAMAAEEMNVLQAILPKNQMIDMQHVGSTAIVGMAAKPIIDIQVAVKSLEDAKVIMVPILQKIGYEYWSENPDPTRLFFVKGMPPFGEKRTHHVHVVEQDSLHWRNKLIFRDYLQTHPLFAKEYETLKFKLAKKYVYDREKYTDEKANFVKQVLNLALQETLAKENDFNEFNQAVGKNVKNWHPAKRPSFIPFIGQYTFLKPLEIEQHAEPLFEALAFNNAGESWTYLPYGPFTQLADFKNWLLEIKADKDTLLYAIFNKKTEKAIGIAGYLRINPEHGVIEVGHLHFSHRLKKTKIATEAMYLMMRYVFDELGYRRYEWKCHTLNQASRQAALRLGFTFESVFRQSHVLKNRNRDTAWFSVLDSEWPVLKQKFIHWLDPKNFDEMGQQVNKLQDC